MTISLNDRVDDIATLHAARNHAIDLTGAIEQIRAEILHHESRASTAERLVGYIWGFVWSLILSRPLF